MHFLIPAKEEGGNTDWAIQMDVSMPFMGGMEATELIRAFELHEGLDRTPIIALTAHASSFRFHPPSSDSVLMMIIVIGDRERCLQAGMDDHITSTLFLPVFWGVTFRLTD